MLSLVMPQSVTIVVDIAAWAAFHTATGYAAHRLKSLQVTARERRNVFASLMEAVKTHSLGQISHALYDVGGEYRRNM